MKKALRTAVRSKLATLDPGVIADVSLRICQQIEVQPWFINAKSVCIFASMPTELQTQQLISQSLAAQKRVFIPRVISPTDMEMLQILPVCLICCLSVSLTLTFLPE